MILDELTILIDADSKGIESTLKRTLQIVTGTVGQMNKEEVDWTSIFTRAVSPALIGGIASMFAFAIGQSLNFQEAMNTTGTAAGESSGQIAQTGASALSASSAVGQSAQNIANAMLQVSAIFGTNTDATNEVTQAMTQLADSGFGSLNDIVAATIPLFQQFGVTTSDQAITMLTDLMHGAEASKESISALAGQFIQFSPALVAAGASFSSFNGLISDFAGRVQSLGLAGADAAFKALADSANSPVGPMELLGQNLTTVKTSITSGDITGLIDNLSKKLFSMGSSAQIVATNMGLSADQVNLLQAAFKKLPTTDADIKNTATSTQSIHDAWLQSDSAIREFTADWNKLVALVTSGTIGNAMTQIGKTIGSTLDSLTSLINGNAIQSIFGPTGIAAINKLAGITPAQSAAALLQEDQTNLGTQLTNNGFSAKQISSIDSAAGSNQSLITALTTALQSGISSSNTSYGNINKTFNLSLPSSGNVSASALAALLYKSFQGVK
jgi:hypothetical protein